MWCLPLHLSGLMMMSMTVYMQRWETMASDARFQQTPHINISKGQSSSHSWAHWLWKWTCGSVTFQCRPYKGCSLYHLSPHSSLWGPKQKTVSYNTTEMTCPRPTHFTFGSRCWLVKVTNQTHLLILYKMQTYVVWYNRTSLRPCVSFCQHQRCPVA